MKRRIIELIVASALALGIIWLLPRDAQPVKAQEDNVIAVPLPCVILDSAVSHEELIQKINYWKFERNYDFQVLTGDRPMRGYTIIATCKN